MATPADVMHCYSQIAATVALMVQLATDKKWGELPEAEAHCASIVAQLKRIEPTVTLSPTQVAEVRLLITKINADQAMVSGIVKPQLEQLLENMGALQQRKNLGKAYGQGR